MSLRSFYVVISLACCLQFVLAVPPLNIRKLYESNEDRIKKDDAVFPQADEDVLELEQLKLKNLENKESTTASSTNLDTNVDVLSAPTVLQNKYISSKTSVPLGQPEEEEQMVVQYRPHHPIVNNVEASRQEDAATNMEKMPTKIAESVLRHPDGQYSSFDMAQYVFWTGDEAGVAKAVEEFIQEGLMSRENAIKFLRDIRLGIEYLQDSYANRVFPNHLKIGALHPKFSHTSVPTAPPTTTTLPPEPEARPIVLSPSLRKALEGIPSLFRLQELNNDRNKENSLDYDEMTGRMRLADFLYAEYSLEDVIYQLAKVMFSQSLMNGSEQAQNALQRLTTFLESEGEHGRISPALQKKILDVILNALSDVLAEHPELLSAARIGLGNSFHKLPKHIIEPMKN